MNTALFPYLTESFLTKFHRSWEGPGPARKGWTRKKGLNPQEGPGPARRAWTHKKGLDPQEGPGPTRRAWTHKKGLDPQEGPGPCELNLAFYYVTSTTVRYGGSITTEHIEPCLPYIIYIIQDNMWVLACYT